MSNGAAIALGTVQFGMAYGIAGRSVAVPPDEVRSILERACEAGIRRLDTAPAYGDIEERLSDLSSGLAFEVVSKIPALPASLVGADATAFVRDSVERSRRRLPSSLVGLLFHNADDLQRPDGDALWGAAVAALEGSQIALGVSAYEPAAVRALAQRLPIAMAQLPGNAFDQRLADCPLKGIEISLRSVLLQGVLVSSTAAARLADGAVATETWLDWQRRNQIRSLPAALGIARGLPGADFCLVGVDNVLQLDQIVEAWRETGPIQAPELSVDDLNVIDPRRWKLAS